MAFVPSVSSSVLPFVTPEFFYYTLGCFLSYLPVYRAAVVVAAEGVETGPGDVKLGAVVVTAVPAGIGTSRAD